MKSDVIFTIVEKLLAVNDFLVAMSRGFFSRSSSRAPCSFGFRWSCKCSWPWLLRQCSFFPLLWPSSLRCLCWFLRPLFWDVCTFPKTVPEILFSSFCLSSLGQSPRWLPWSSDVTIFSSSSSPTWNTSHPCSTLTPSHLADDCGPPGRTEQVCRVCALLPSRPQHLDLQMHSPFPPVPSLWARVCPSLFKTSALILPLCPFRE